MSKKLKRILQEKYGYECSECHISQWLDKPLVLELDHINGDRTNNKLSNLRLLCPNCHSQTITFRGRNKTPSSVSDEDLLNALQTTENIRQALLKVGLAAKGGNYTRAGKLLNISYEKAVDTKNSQYGTLWIHNGTKNKKIKKEELQEYLNVGWQQGRLVDKKPPSAKDRIWVTNGIKTSLCPPDKMPKGWWRGRIMYNS